MKQLYILLILFPLFSLAQKNKISVTIDFEIVEKRLFLKDTMYICKDKTKIRVTKDTLYIYAKNQYLKVKR